MDEFSSKNRQCITLDLSFYCFLVIFVVCAFLSSALKTVYGKTSADIEQASLNSITASIEKGDRYIVVSQDLSNVQPFMRRNGYIADYSGNYNIIYKKADSLKSK